MGIFGKRQKQSALPGDIVSKMERFGRYEFNPQANADGAEDIWGLMGDLYPKASADSEGFIATLADAVLPVGGWAVYEPPT